ncbi:MAG TPA: T9SS type A sorting domain-containing protein [Chitinophagaceae bacterium]|nr:T9SS type A sorting domain-containing protein [Chitinophagaceae bacterium]
MKKKIPVLTLIALLTCIQSFEQWNGDSTQNTPVCNAAGAQSFPRSVPDGAGGAFICWQDYRDGKYLGNIYVQHLDGKGNAVWAKNGIAIDTGNQSERPRIVTDNAGGIIVAWIDHRYATQTNNEEADIFAQRIDAGGNAVWAVNGVALDSNADPKAHIAILADGKGGAFLAWDEYYQSRANLIFGQHVDGNGNILWGTLPYAPKICYPSSGFAYEPQVVTDGRGGMIVCWYDNRDGSDDNIYAQRLDTNGTKKWNYSDLIVCQADYDQEYPRMIPDGNKGAIIAWDDNRTGYFGPTFDVYIQKLDSSGNKKWLNSTDPWYNNNGIAVCTAQYRQFFPQLTSDSAGGAYVAWCDERESFALYAQRINNNGDTAFKANGIRITPRLSYSGAVLFAEDANILSMMTDNKGNALIAWPDVRTTDAHIYGQAIDTSGASLWTPGGVAISVAPGTQQKPEIIPGSTGNGIVVWEDNRNTNAAPDIYCSLLTSSGTLPVEMLPLTAQYLKSGIMLQWQTQTETNSKYFVIQRAVNPATFDSIGVVEGAVHSSSALHYSFFDASPLTVANYYRLKQVDEDGRYNYSNIVAVKTMGQNLAVTVYPNPAAAFITINMPGITTADRIVIYNMQGQAVKQWQHVSVNNSFDVTRLAAGQYFVSVVTNKTSTTTKIIIK